MKSVDKSLTFAQLRRELLKDNNKCELCGSRRSLDVHHIIPRCVGGEDTYDNLIVICCGCHGKLTPKSTLTKIGLKKASENGVRLGNEPGKKLVTKKSVFAKELIVKYSKDFDGSMSDSDLIKKIGCARGSFYKYKRELRGETNEYGKSGYSVTAI